MFTYVAKNDPAQSITTRFPAPSPDAVLAWWAAAPSELYYVLVAKILAQDNDHVSCVFLDPATGVIGKDESGADMEAVDLDLSDLAVVWRNLPSTIDAPVGGGDHAILCPNAAWFDDLKVSKHLTMQPLIKFPFGWEESLPATSVSASDLRELMRRASAGNPDALSQLGKLAAARIARTNAEGL